MFKKSFFAVKEVGSNKGMVVYVSDEETAFALGQRFTVGYEVQSFDENQKDAALKWAGVTEVETKHHGVIFSKIWLKSGIMLDINDKDPREVVFTSDTRERLEKLKKYAQYPDTWIELGEHQIRTSEIAAFKFTM